jgi:Ca-activated chloride channel family protein
VHVDPLLPLPVIGVMAGVGAAFVVARARRGAPLSVLARAAAMVVLAAVIALDPAFTGGSSEARRAAADVLFVVDTTSSMAALDYRVDSPRLDGVRADIVELAAEFPGAHFSLVRFDSQARLELPWTTDLGAIETAVSVLRQERAVFSRGSQLDLPLQVIDEQLPRPSATSDDGYSIIFYFSDGEVRRSPDTEEAVVDRRTGVILPDDESQQGISSFAELAADVDGGAVFGYGTPEGAPMLQFFGNDAMFVSADAAVPASPYVQDFATGQTAISRLDEGNLVEIANDLGVPYVHRSEPGGLSATAAALADGAPTVSDGSRESPRRLYWIPALALLALLLWQAAVTVNEVTATQRILGGPIRTPIGGTHSAAPRRARTLADEEPAA